MLLLNNPIQINSEGRPMTYTMPCQNCGKTLYFDEKPSGTNWVCRACAAERARQDDIRDACPNGGTHTWGACPTHVGICCTKCGAWGSRPR